MLYFQEAILYKWVKCSYSWLPVQRTTPFEPCYPPVGFCPKLQSGIVGLKTYWEWMNDLICGVLFRQKQKKIKIKILVQNVSNYIILHVMYDLYFTKAR